MKPNDRIRIWFDSGCQGYVRFYGTVKSIGRVYATIVWENGVTQRIHENKWHDITVVTETEYLECINRL